MWFFLLILLLSGICNGTITAFIQINSTYTISYTLESFYTTLGSAPEQASMLVTATFLNTSYVTDDCRFQVRKER